MIDPDSTRIAAFLVAKAPFVTKCVRTSLLSMGCAIDQRGSGLDLVFTVDLGEGEVEFHLHNLLLEIATVDRAQTPLRFDERLLDEGFFLSKTAQFIRSKLRILLHLLQEKDVEKALERIEADSAGPVATAAASLRTRTSTTATAVSTTSARSASRSAVRAKIRSAEGASLNAKRASISSAVCA